MGQQKFAKIIQFDRWLSNITNNIKYCLLYYFQYRRACYTDRNRKIYDEKSMKE